MIVDTSALIAIIKGEESESEVRTCLGGSEKTRMSAAGFVELMSVVGRTNETRRRAEALLDLYSVDLHSFDGAQAGVAAAAYQRFGRGSGHPAKLNMGDTYSYALAMTTGEPLLFVGDDFAQTDVTPAIPRDTE